MSKERTWFSTFLGVTLTVVGMTVMFFIASIEGVKEVRASNVKSAKILEVWQEENPDEDFPKERTELVEYENKEYYFAYDEDENWYFAHSGGVDYIFNDLKFYVLTGLTLIVTLYVSHVNYVSTIRTIVRGPEFVSTLEYYKKRKDKIEKYTQYIPDFCSYKNKQARDIKVREIVEKANLEYDKYIKGEINLNALEEWQSTIMQDIRRIKVNKIYSSDLLQEGRTTSSSRITILPMSQSDHHRRFMLTGAAQKVVTVFLSGLVASFGIVLGNWFLGLAYAMTVLISYISSVIIATDFANTTLRNRFIAKGDLLMEFDNIKENFMGGESHGNRLNDNIHEQGDGRQRDEQDAI